jgi:hypothetical protein
MTDDSEVTELLDATSELLEGLRRMTTLAERLMERATGEPLTEQEARDARRELDTTRAGIKWFDDADASPSGPPPDVAPHAVKCQSVRRRVCRGHPTDRHYRRAKRLQRSRGANGFWISDPAIRYSFSR